MRKARPDPYFPACDDQFVFLLWKFAGQDGSIENRVNGYLALIFSMDMGHVVLIHIVEKHSDKNSIEHRDCRR